MVAKFSPIFKGPDVLPQRFPNFGKTNNISLDKISLGKKYFSPLVFGVRWQDFLRSSDPFSFEGNASELHFYSNVCDSYPEYGYTDSNLENT